jgi:hypothetical protein
MKEKMLYKTLVVGVIVLFVGVGVNPAFAVDVSKSVSDSEEECDLCPKASNQQINRLINLLDKLERYDNQLLVLSKHYPEFEEKYQELSEIVTDFKEINKELKSDNFDVNKFCNIAYPLLFILVAPAVFYLTWDVNLFTTLLLPFVILISIPGLILTITWMALCWPGPHE